MQAALWFIPSTTDSSPSDDNLANAPSLELQTRVDSSSYGDVKRFAVSCIIATFDVRFCTNVFQTPLYLLLLFCFDYSS